VIPDAETDLSFLNFASPGRPYTAPRRSPAASKKAPRSELTEASQESGAPSKTRTCDHQVRNTKPTQEVTRGCVCCIARACKERHQAAPVAAPGSIRLQPRQLSPVAGATSAGVPWAGPHTLERRAGALRVTVGGELPDLRSLGKGAFVLTATSGHGSVGGIERARFRAIRTRTIPTKRQKTAG
jgi:hypothetical protein